MLKRVAIIFLVLLCVSLVYFYFGKTNLSISETTSLTFLERGVAIKIFIADTEEERVRGLSGVKKLKQNEGMLFIFQDEDDRTFWMKDMNFPLDAVWIDENFSVVGVTENITNKPPVVVFKSPSPVKYVLEVNAGFVKKFMIKVGDRVSYDLFK